MRSLQFSHEEIELILRALGIAENSFYQMRKNYIDQLVNVRGIDSLAELAKEADFMFNIENQFCDLLLSIKAGEKDV